MKMAKRSVRSARKGKTGNTAMNHKEENWLSARTAFYFYSIITFSLVLPAGVVGFLLFSGIAVKVMLSTLCLSFLGGLAYLHRKITLQLQALQATFENLDRLEGDCQISLIGGLIQIRIEQSCKEVLPSPAKPDGAQGGTPSGGSLLIE